MYIILFNYVLLDIMKIDEKIKIDNAKIKKHKSNVKKATIKVDDNVVLKDRKIDNGKFNLKILVGSYIIKSQLKIFIF